MTKTKKYEGRIGLVLSTAPGYSETFFRSKIGGLMKTGHHVVLFCSENPHKFDMCPVVLLPKPSKSIFKQLGLLTWVYIGLISNLNSVFRFIQLERNDGISFIRIFKRLYTHAPVFKQDLDWLHFGFGTLALGCENLAAANQVRMAVSFRGFDIGVYPLKHPGCYKRLWEKVSKIHVISDDITELVYKNGFQDQAPIVKITPAIDTGYFLAPEQPIESSILRMVTVARLHWKKGLDYTLEALALLKQAGVSFEYRIIGTGTEEEALKFACYQLDLQEEVKFLGKLEHNDVKRYLEASNIYIQYSVQEGFCNAVLEAQAMGLLCVVSDAEGLAENVLDDQTGWVVAKRQPQLLKNKIEEVITLTDADKQKIISFAKERIKNTFNLENQNKLFDIFYT